MSVHRALLATTLATSVSFLLALFSAIVIARLLTPAEIGIFSIAVSLIAFAHVLRDFGVSQYLVQLKTITRDDLRAGFTVMMLSSWSMALLLVLMATPTAAFYAQPGIAEVFRVLALSFALLPFGSHILSLLKREMRFGTVALVNTASAVVSTGVTLLAAWRGYGYLSMPWGTVAGNVTTIAMLFVIHPELALLPPRFRNLRQVVSFGGKSSAANLIRQLAASGPDLILGKAMSMAAVAHFSRASSPLGMLATKIDEVLWQVFGPAFARGLREGQKPHDLLVRTIRVHSGLQLSLIAVLALMSESMILFLFGPQWEQAAALAPWLCASALVGVPVTFASPALVSAGHAGAALRASAASSLVLLLGLMTAFWLSLEQLVAVMLPVRILEAWIWQQALQRNFAFSRSAMWEATLPSILLMGQTALPSLFLLLLLRVGPRQPPLLELLLIGSCGVLFFVFWLRRSDHPLRQELQRMAPPLAKLFGPLS